MLNIKPEQIIIDFIHRHTIAVDRCLPIVDRERAMLAVNLLVRAGRISEWHHACDLRYWTVAGPRPLFDTSLARSLGILSFCHGSESRSLITRDELAVYFPRVFRHGLPSGHYIEVTPHAQKLGHVRVDGGQSKVNRLVARTQRSIQKYEEQAGFRKLIRSGCFELTWIVPTQPKQRRLIEALEPLVASGIQIRVFAMPELLNVVAHIPRPNNKSL